MAIDTFPHGVVVESNMRRRRLEHRRAFGWISVALLTLLILDLAYFGVGSTLLAGMGETAAFWTELVAGGALSAGFGFLWLVFREVHAMHEPLSEAEGADQ